MKLDEQITNDLITKVTDDIKAVLRRTLSIAPKRMPVAMAAGALGIGFAAAELQYMSPEGREPGSDIDPECLLLAALIIARADPSAKDAIGEAYKDLEALKAAGRFQPLSGDGER